MFTLCMSRKLPSTEDGESPYIPHRPVKEGHLFRYSQGFWRNKWSEEWFVLYEDSTLAWFSNKEKRKPKGFIKISECPELLAVAEWTQQIPNRPRIPHGFHIGQILAIGTRLSKDACWIIANSSSEVNDWMTAISNTLPPPPQLPLENKRLSFISERDILSSDRKKEPTNGQISSKKQCYSCTATPKDKKMEYEPYKGDHTVLSGVVVDWGQGWGWGLNDSFWTTGTCFTEAAVLSSAIYSTAVTDCTINTLGECDWGGFGDFAF